MSDTITYPNKAAQLRQRLLGQQVEPAKPFDLGGGAQAFIRTPLIADRDKVFELAKAKLSRVAQKQAKGEAIDDGDLPVTRISAAACIVLAVDDVGTPLFSAEDMDALLATPIDGSVSQLMAACVTRLNAEPVAAGK